jgi:3-isopropylmalate/(R)-2-methylmalate dehydratase large subunit
MQPKNIQSKSIIEKIWDAHVVSQKLGHPAIFAIDFMLIHEVTSAQAFDVLKQRSIPLYDRGRLLATLDHSIPTRSNRFEIFDDSARIQVETLRKNAADFQVPLYDFDSGKQGIVHVIGPEQGVTQPGMTIVCGDSHTSTHGAFGALAFGVGTSEVGYVLATSCILQQKPRTMRVEFRGTFQRGVYPKDAILKLISTIGIGGATGHIIEYTGSAIENMSMEERMTVCNMSIECGARAGLIAPDKTTYDYLKGRPFAPDHASWEHAVAYWQSLRSDKGCSYDREVIIDIDILEPMITWGTNPEQGCSVRDTIPQLATLPPERRDTARRALEYVKIGEGAPVSSIDIDWAFIGSCTNGRIEDLRIAASILKDRKVHKDVTFYIVPGSEAVREQACREGLDKIFEDAGASFRLPGCSMCLGMNDDKVPAGKRCISSSNRNFVGRQGTGSITHLASPATVAATAVTGKITPVTDL